MTGPRTHALAVFPPVPVSARQARAFLRTFLEDADRSDLLDLAELPLSEVVTNALLHAHTDFTVVLELTHPGLRVDVVDHSPQVPADRGYAVEATTGRGMGVVATMTARCGVERRADGKSVWFLVGPEVPRQRSHEDILAAWVVDLDLEVPEWSGHVLLLGAPLRLWLAAREHHDALLRELTLFAGEHPSAVRPEQLAVTDLARGWVSQAVIAAVERFGHDPRHSATPAAVLPGLPETVDLTVPVDQDAARAFATMKEVLDRGEDLAVRGLLLARPGLPEVIAVRDWACEQGIAQAVGGRAERWPGTDQDRFTAEVHGRTRRLADLWDVTGVTDSDVGVLVSDDADRIIAVSSPLAAALGWEPGDLVGRRVTTIVPPRLRESYVAGLSRHLTTGHTWVLGLDLRLPVLRRDGSETDATVRVEEVDVAGADGGAGVYVAWITADEPGG